MIAFVALLALVDVFLISQVSFWGAVPVAFVVILYLFRNEARVVELVLAGAVYGFCVSIFGANNEALVTLLAYTGATSATVLVLRIIQRSRLRIRARGWEAALVTTLFTLVFWSTNAINNFQSLSFSSVALFTIWSAAVNLGLVIVSHSINAKVQI
jgi:hypothetical protein